MELGDLLVKIANNARLTPQELDELKRAGNETQQRNSFIAGNTTPQNQLSVNLPINILFSETLSKDSDDVLVNVSAQFRNILIVGSGRTTLTGATAENIVVQFNGDTATNYDLETMYRLNNVSSGNQNLSINGFAIGTFPTADATANSSGNAFGVFPHIQSTVWKGGTGIGGAYLTGAAGAIVFTDYGIWENTSSVQVIRIFPESSPTSKFLAGTSISVYGLL